MSNSPFNTDREIFPTCLAMIGIVGAWRSPRPRSYSRAVESEAAMMSCVGGDMNNDGRPDVICAGSGGVIRWYENLGR